MLKKVFIQTLIFIITAATSYYITGKTLDKIEQNKQELLIMGMPAKYTLMSKQINPTKCIYAFKTSEGKIIERSETRFTYSPFNTKERAIKYAWKMYYRQIGWTNCNEISESLTIVTNTPLIELTTLNEEL